MVGFRIFLYVCLGCCVWGTETNHSSSSSSGATSSVTSSAPYITTTSFATAVNSGSQTISIQPSVSTSFNSISTVGTPTLLQDPSSTLSLFTVVSTSSSENVSSIHTTGYGMASSTYAVETSSSELPTETTTIESRTGVPTVSDSSLVISASSTAVGISSASEFLASIYVEIETAEIITESHAVSNDDGSSMTDLNVSSSMNTVKASTASIVASYSAEIHSKSITETLLTGRVNNSTFLLDVSTAYVTHAMSVSVSLNSSSEELTTTMPSDSLNTTLSPDLRVTPSLANTKTPTLPASHMVTLSSLAVTPRGFDPQSPTPKSINEDSVASDLVSVGLMPSSSMLLTSTVTLSSLNESATVTIETEATSSMVQIIESSHSTAIATSSVQSIVLIGVTQSQTFSTVSSVLSQGYISPSISPSPHSTFIETTSSHGIQYTGQTYRILLTFEGSCGRLEDSDQLKIEFLKALVDIILDFTPELTEDDFELTQLVCDPFKIVLLIKNIHKRDSLSMLTLSVRNLTMNVPVIDSSIINFHATSIQLYPVGNDTTGGIGEPTQRGLATSDIVIIVISALLFAFLIILGGVVFCRECYKRKRAASFDLQDVPHVNLKLDDFTLTRIPRPKMTFFENRNNQIATNGRTQPPKSRHISEKDGVPNMKANSENIHVRMSDHSDGIIIGVTCSSPPRQDGSPTSSDGPYMDQSGQSLLKGDYSEGGTANPSCQVDDEVNVSLIHENGEEEFL